MRLYGLMMVLAAGAGILIAVLRAGLFGLEKQDVCFALLYGLVGFIIGAKLLFLITSLPLILGHASAIFSSWESINQILVMGGYSFVGGFAGAGLGAYLYCRQFHIRWWAFVNTAMPGVPLSLAIARIGCFLAGCCHGVESRFGIPMNHAPLAPHDVSLFPTQLIEIMVNVILFFVLMRMKKREDGRMLFFYLICYSALRIFLEQFRADSAYYTYFLLSVTTWICMITLIVSIFCLIRLDKRNPT